MFLLVMHLYPPARALTCCCLPSPPPRPPPSQIADEFVAAHPERKLPKKWVGDALKQWADWHSSLKRWELKPVALQLLGMEPAEAAAAAGALLAEAAAAAAGATAVAAAEGSLPAAAAAAAEQGGGAEPAPTPGAAADAKVAAEAGGIQRFFRQQQVRTRFILTARDAC